MLGDLLTPLTIQDYFLVFHIASFLAYEWVVWKKTTTWLSWLYIYMIPFLPNALYYGLVHLVKWYSTPDPDKTNELFNVDWIVWTVIISLGVVCLFVPRVREFRMAIALVTCVMLLVSHTLDTLYLFYLFAYLHVNRVNSRWVHLRSSCFDEYDPKMVLACYDSIDWTLQLIGLSLMSLVIDLWMNVRDSIIVKFLVQAYRWGRFFGDDVVRAYNVDIWLAVAVVIFFINCVMALYTIDNINDVIVLVRVIPVMITLFTWKGLLEYVLLYKYGQYPVRGTTGLLFIRIYYHCGLTLDPDLTRENEDLVHVLIDLLNLDPSDPAVRANLPSQEEVDAQMEKYGLHSDGCDDDCSTDDLQVTARQAVEVLGTPE